MATLVSPLTKRTRLSLGDHCTPRKLCNAITDSFFPKTYSVKDNEKAAFACSSFYGRQKERNAFDLPTIVAPMEAESVFDTIASTTDLVVVEEKEPVPDSLEQIPENPPVNISCLPNCGNTCYLNSVLHVLRYTPNFMEYLHYLVSMHGSLIKTTLEDTDKASLVCLSQLHRLYKTMQKHEESISLGKNITEAEDIAREVSTFIAVLRQATDQFEEDQQHDAHEFLAVLVTNLPYGLDHLNLSLNSDSAESPAATPRRKRKRKRPRYAMIRYRRKSSAKKPQRSVGKTDEVEIPSPVVSGSINTVALNKNASCEFLSSIFDGRLRQILKCLECEEVKERQEAFFDLKVPLVGTDKDDDDDDDEPVTLLDCLMKESYLDGDNKYFCSNCNSHNEARLTYRVVVPPSVLLLHLSWLSELSGLTEEEKCGTQIAIPLCLGSSEESAVLSTTDTQFTLYGAIMHIGSTSVDGHYVSFIKIPHNHGKNEISAQSTTFEQLLNNSDQCCSSTSFCDAENDMCGKEYSWYLFDDDHVTTIDVDDITLPYLKYLGPTATPYMLFYQRL